MFGSWTSLGFPLNTNTEHHGCATGCKSQWVLISDNCVCDTLVIVLDISIHLKTMIKYLLMADTASKMKYKMQQEITLLRQILMEINFTLQSLIFFKFKEKSHFIT